MRLQWIVLLGLVSVCGLSRPLQAAAADTQPPSVPSGLVIYSFSPAILKAQWNVASDNVGVTGYRLDVATNAGFTSLVSGFNNLDVGNVLSRRLLGLTAATTYYVRVRAYDAAGNVSANSATGDARTQSVPDYPIADWVRTGANHWAYATGDTRHPDDSNDYDDSFGAHGGFETPASQNYPQPEYIVLNSSNAEMQFDMSTPSAGTYILTSVLGLIPTFPVRVSTCPGAGCPGGVWTDLTPDATTTNGGLNEYVWSWNITIPGGQPVTRFRYKLAGCAGCFPARVRWAVLRQVVATPFTSPPTDGVHPRLMFDSTELAALRVKVLSGTPAYLYQQMLAVCDGQVPANASWDQLNSTNETHDAGLVLLQCSLAAALSRTAPRIQKAKDFLSRINAWPEWAAAGVVPGQQEQDRAGIAEPFAIAYDIMYNDLSNTERTTYANRLYQDADWLDSHTRGGWWWVQNQRENNYRPQIQSAIGMIGLVLDHCVESQEFIKWTIDNNVLHLDTTFDPAGGYGETSSYYTYGNERFIAFADALKRSGGPDLFAYHNDVLKTSATWIVDMMVGDASFNAPLGDSAHDPFAAWSIAALEHFYGSGLMRWMFDRLYPDQPSLFNAVVTNWRSFALFQTLLYYDESTAPINPDTVLARTHVYDVPIVVSPDGTPGQSGYIFMRSSYGSKDALYLATQCGDDQDGHGHHDHGSLFFSGYQQILLDDFGKIGDYGSTSENWHVSDQAHNAVIADTGPSCAADSTCDHAPGDGRCNLSSGKCWRGQGHEDNIQTTLCTIKASLGSSFASLASMDSTSAYGYASFNAMQKALRHVLFVNTGADRGYAVVIDDVNKDGALHDYKLRYLGCDSTSTAAWCPTKGAVAWSTVESNHVRETGTKANLDVFVAEPPSTTITTGNQYGANYLDIDSTQTRGMYVNLLFPTSTALGVTLPSVTTVRDAAMSGFTLNTDTILFNRVGGVQTSANVSSDGTVLFVQGTATADKFLATNATSFSYQGIQYLSAPQPPSSVAVEYTANGLTAEMDMGSATTLTLRLATQPQSVQFNGQAVPFTAANGLVTVTNLVGRGTLVVNTTATAIPGDLDGSGLIDILDLQRMVNCLLGMETDQAVIQRADLDGQNGATVLDLQLLVNKLLGL